MSDAMMKAEKFDARHRMHSTRSKVLFVLACAVVFATVYALILPALTMEQPAYCGLEEHTHDASCYAATDSAPTCGLVEGEGHTHTDACYELQRGDLVCGLSDDPHVHTDACYAQESELVCGLTEGEAYAPAVPEALADDPAEAIDGASTGDDAGTLPAFEAAEPHVHTDACYATTNALACGLTEGEPAHIHTDECYAWNQVAICGQDEAPAHAHTDACYAASAKPGASEPVLTCEKVEHTHSLACYSNPEADFEEPAVWEAGMDGLELTGEWSHDVLAVAQSQLGYSESPNNYQVDEDGITTKGWTRYGAWYGDPYGDWCAMFVSFCLNYAGVPADQFPRESSCPRWIDLLADQEDWDLFRQFDGYDPQPGDLVFFDNDSDNVSDHVGLVTELLPATDYEPAQLKTIEGNSSDRVQTATYVLDDERIVGYGALPQNPDYVPADMPGDSGGENPADPIGPADPNAVDAETFRLTAQAADGAIVSVSGSRDSLPFPADELTVTVEIVGSENARAMVDAALVDTALADGEVYLYDVRLWHDGVEVEPTGPVALTFEGIAQTDASEAKVFHIDEANDRLTDMNAAIADGSVVVDTDHFSIYGVVVPSTGNVEITQTIAAMWNTETKRLDSVQFTVQSSTGQMVYRLEYCDDATAQSPAWTQVGSETGKIDKNTQAMLTLTAENMANAPLDRVYRVHGSKDKNNTGSTAGIYLVDILDTVKSGFSSWLVNNYVQDFGGTALPANQADLYNAFTLYYSLPTLTIAARDDNGTTWVDATTNGAGPYAYAWEYRDANGVWQTLTDKNDNNEDIPVTGASFNAREVDLLLNGGADIRCKMYTADASKTLQAVSEPLFVNPLQAEYNEAIVKINEGLNLGDLAIGGIKFKNAFYYGNVAKDSRVPFSDATSYERYLAKLYLDNGGGAVGLQAVAEKWDYYLYDLYDPSKDNKTLNNISNGYPTAGTYGDSILDWPKDSASSFHGTNTYIPKINQLDYSYLEENVDYSNFVTGLDKTATAVAAGDANSGRAYDIDIVADAQAKAVGPVAMVIQVQSTWQMFDMLHANALDGGGTAVGAVANNTELANLYDIKHALLRFVDYMQNNYPGNNLVLGITEVQHAGSQTMFLGKDLQGKDLCVTNDYDTLRQAILDWDTFGNCEHVHYDTEKMVLATKNLASNLSGWKDMFGYEIQYEDIEKVAVIIGGPTENKESTNGYACPLPWSTFQTAGLNSVYGIRVNEGTPNGTAPVISWLDMPINAGGTPFRDAQGDAFTEKYVATTEDAVFNTLVSIAKNEMGRKGIEITAKDKYVDDVTVTDTVAREFTIDTTVPIVVKILNKDGSLLESREIELSDPNLSVVENEDGTTTVTYNFGQVKNTTKCVLHFRVKAKDDYIGSNNVFTNVDTPSLTYDHHKIDAAGNVTGVVDHYKVTCDDTPQVNVPIQFTTVDGEIRNINVGESVDFKDLSTEIAKNAEDLVDNYGQINGTLSYTWVLPDGTEEPAGSVTVKNGSIGEQQFPDKAYEFTGNAVGRYTGTLKVTFTPETVDENSKNFSDVTTRTAVKELTQSGIVKVNVKGTGDPSTTPTTVVCVTKVWDDGAENHVDDTVTFELYASVGGEEPVWKDQTVLRAGNKWTYTFTNLPYKDEYNTLIKYYVRETDIPSGYFNSAITFETLDSGAWVSLSKGADLADGGTYVIAFSKENKGVVTTGALTTSGVGDLSTTVATKQDATDDVKRGNAIAIGGVNYDSTLISSNGEQPNTLSSAIKWTAYKNDDGTFSFQNAYTKAWLSLSKDGFSTSKNPENTSNKDLFTTRFTWSSGDCSLKGSYYEKEDDYGKDGKVKTKYLKIKDDFSAVQADGNPQSLELFTYVNDDAVASENNPAEKYYAFTAINAVWDPVYDPDPTLSFTATTNKTIDYLGDGVVNNDTDLSGSNAYRIYLDAQSMTAGGVDLLIVEDSTTSMSTRYGDSTRIMTLDALINGTPSGDGSRSGDGFIYNFLRQNPQNKVAVVKFAGSNDRENHAYEDEKDYVAKITFPWQSATEIANKNGALTPDACTADVLEMKPGTNYETAFLRMDEMLKQVAGDGNAKVVVFISDGEPNAIVNESGIIIQKKDFNHLESSL